MSSLTPARRALVQADDETSLLFIKPRAAESALVALWCEDLCVSIWGEVREGHAGRISVTLDADRLCIVKRGNVLARWGRTGGKDASE